MADPQHMSSEPNKDGGRTVDGGGPPGAYPPPWIVDLMVKLEQLGKEVNRVGRMCERIGQMVKELGRAPSAGSSPPASPTVASDRELDSERGNFRVKKNPKQWNGEDHTGRLLSECDPDFLDVLAESKDYKAAREDEDAAKLEGEEKAQKLKYAGFSRKDAARARGWAARLRAGWFKKCDGEHPEPACKDPQCWQGKAKTEDWG